METIDPRVLLVQIAERLERLNIPYLVTGGIAVYVWGRPRFTADIDIVVELHESNLSALERALRELGTAGYLDADAMRDALRIGGEFNFIDEQTGIKVDFWMLKNDEFDRQRLSRRVAKTILGKTVYFSSPEDLILSKLRWYKASGSSRQIEDVESIVTISGDRLDFKYVEVWAAKLGCTDIFSEVKNRPKRS
ncbi:hypothetical protein A3F28_01645 [Candidatus Uhrbacteria bacterium RIFCSPHIGHO2_12_FULL_57_11]|uniref:Nucleotidyltransferase family protein n=2 Tax=Candidatus Uhriibacteriota TaxID=1752732 RepID=A0A1F7UMJ6_9BACT|nr:MAG: hypothetical protein A3D72_01645 [Candidatus Uhrbacteria bacterium RIFCSPHIGHO2_02_FULL_57_19]OGL78984.1 MAG: hypothetical protein A3F28_01645 [Candidatus Uhrbacteria bacterium RIFCSPHIGHO2_12_FULL_57_11]